ncbi:MAG: hypothetical protein AB2708_20445, partial [Candidatus Thiodiazotropha taylori]
KGNTGVFAHWEKSQKVPIIGIIVGHNQVVKAFTSLTRTPGTAQLFAWNRHFSANAAPYQPPLTNALCVIWNP